MDLVDGAISTFLARLRASGSAKVADGHWPITPWEATPGIREALDRLVAATDGEPEFTMPYQATGLLNLFYCSALAVGSSPSPNRLVPRNLMRAFVDERADRLMNNGVVRLAAMTFLEERSLPLSDSFEVDSGVAGRLSALLSAHAEARKWVLHRVESGFHGPYVWSGDSYIVQTSDTHDFPHLYGQPTGQLHIAFKLRPEAIGRASLDMFGHLPFSLSSLSSDAVILATDATRRLSAVNDVRAFMRMLEEEIHRHVTLVNQMSMSQLSAGLGARFLEACLFSAKIAYERRVATLADFPTELESLQPWQGSRNEFLALIANGALIT